jgi:antibiotic biosynthesis monooxygenase (ABM) superfamily enzyme
MAERSGPRREPVTVTIARRVAPGRETDFEEFSAVLTRAASRYPGFLGAGVLRPGHVGEPWHVVFRFDSTHVHRVTGLETWFALPSRTAPAPPRWKMFAVSVVGIYVLQLVLNLAVTPFALPLALRVALVAIAVTALMTWLVMPRAAVLLQDWLYAPPRHA